VEEVRLPLLIKLLDGEPLLDGIDEGKCVDDRLPERLLERENDDEALADRVRVRDTLTLALAVARRDGDVVRDALAVDARDALPDALTLSEGKVVAEASAVALAAVECVSDGDPLGDTVDKGEEEKETLALATVETVLLGIAEAD
jgi:hypothetical protein